MASELTFPFWEYVAAKNQPKPMMVNNKFLAMMPDELVVIKEIFWDNWKMIQPSNKSIDFHYEGGLRNPQNFWEEEIVEGFVDASGQGWVKVKFNPRVETHWFPFEVVAMVVPEQLAYKILYEGWIYQHKYWWKVTEIWEALEVPKVIDLTLDVMPGSKVEEVEVVPVVAKEE